MSSLFQVSRKTKIMGAPHRVSGAINVPCLLEVGLVTNLDLPQEALSVDTHTHTHTNPWRGNTFLISILRIGNFREGISYNTPPSLINLIN